MHDNACQFMGFRNSSEVIGINKLGCRCFAGSRLVCTSAHLPGLPRLPLPQAAGRVAAAAYCQWPTTRSRHAAAIASRALPRRRAQLLPSRTRRISAAVLCGTTAAGQRHMRGGGAQGGNVVHGLDPGNEATFWGIATHWPTLARVMTECNSTVHLWARRTRARLHPPLHTLAHTTHHAPKPRLHPPWPP